MNRLSTAALLVLLPLSARAQTVSPKPDWMVNPAPYTARVEENKGQHELILDNGLARRVIRLTPNAATVSLKNLVSGEELLRAVSPEARVTLDGTAFGVGGLDGQKIQNYLKAEWVDDLRNPPGSYQFSGREELPMSERLKWKKRPEWLARDLPWPAPGKHVVLTFGPPADKQSDGPVVEVHYELYHGIPLFSKWLVVHNRSAKAIRVDAFIADELKLAEVESAVNTAPITERPNLWVVTDFAFNDMSAYYAQPAVELIPDPEYATQVHYSRQTPCLLRCKPPVGPAQDVAAGGSFESFRVFELLLDSADRERRTLAQRKMYRVIAPWTQENPLMFHKVQSDPATVRAAIDQAAEVGFEMVILSFGSGFNFESRDRNYWAELTKRPRF